MDAHVDRLGLAVVDRIAGSRPAPFPVQVGQALLPDGHEPFQACLVVRRRLVLLLLLLVVQMRLIALHQTATAQAVHAGDEFPNAKFSKIELK